MFIHIKKDFTVSANAGTYFVKSWCFEVNKLKAGNIKLGQIDYSLNPSLAALAIEAGKGIPCIPNFNIAFSKAAIPNIYWTEILTDVLDTNIFYAAAHYNLYNGYNKSVVFSTPILMLQSDNIYISFSVVNKTSQAWNVVNTNIFITLFYE